MGHVTIMQNTGIKTQVNTFKLQEEGLEDIISRNCRKCSTYL